MPRFSTWIKSTVLRRTTVADDDLVALVTDTPVGAAITAANLRTSIGGVQSSNGSVTDVIALTQAEYDAIVVKNPTTQYLIV